MSFNFWLASAELEGLSEKKKFLLKSPYDKKRTKEIILSVHPEYVRLTLKKAKRPEWCKPWEYE